MKKLIIAFLFILPLFIFGCGSGEVPAPAEEKKPPIVEKEFPIDQSKTFVHPGMLHAQADFDRIKAKVDAGTQPWMDGWNMLIKNSHAQLSYNPNPVVKLIRGGNSAEEPEADNYSRAFNDVAAAYQCAIRWKITGNAAYADKAVQILNAWASTCKLISGDSNKDLAAGIYGYQFANAAEIMRSYAGWSANDFAAFQKWMLDVFYPISSDFIVRHNGTCISQLGFGKSCQHHGNRYFNR